MMLSVITDDNLSLHEKMTVWVTGTKRKMFEINQAWKEASVAVLTVWVSLVLIH